MNRSNQPDLAKEQFWRQTFRDWKASGQTRKQFCAQRGLSPHTFDYWRQVLTKRDAQGPLPSPTPPSLPNKPLLVPVKVVLSASLEVKLPNGSSILVPAGFDPKHLKQLLEVLEQPEC
jgi:transposase